MAELCVTEMAQICAGVSTECDFQLHSVILDSRTVLWLSCSRVEEREVLLPRVVDDSERRGSLVLYRRMTWKMVH